MKLKIEKFADGKEAYGSSNIKTEINKQDPIDVELIDLPDEEAMLLLDYPNLFKLVLEEGVYKVVKK